MRTQIHLPLGRRSQRGATLIEALVALMVMSFGMVALVGLMGNLRRSSDVAKQRSEAMRQGQAELGALRSFSILKKPAGSTQPDYDTDLFDVVAARSISGENDNTTFVLSRTVTPLVKNLTEPQARTVSVNVAWTDRAGVADSVTLNTVISRTDPSFSGALGVTPPTNGIRLPDGRNPVIPTGAKNLNNGSSAFRPSGGSATVWVFNNVTGVITGKCSIDTGTAVTSLTPGDVESCKNNTVGYLVSGTVRFSSTSPANPSAPEATAQPLSVYLSLTPSQFSIKSGGADVLASGGAYPISPNYECFNDSSTTPAQAFVNYNCIVYPNTQSPPNWWGQVLLSGLDLGTTAAQYKVCRYSADYNGNGYTYVANATSGYDYLNGSVARKFLIDNEEHPAVYQGVSYSLARQNFLVVRGDVSCPAASPPDPSTGIFVDYSTIQLQPS